MPVAAAAPLTRLSAFLRGLATIKPRGAKMTIGVDIGSSSVKAVALGPSRGAARQVLGFHVATINGNSADPIAAIKEAVQALPPAGRAVNIAVTGQWVVMRIVELPNMKPAEMKQALPFEAQRYLPFDLQDVIIDGVTLGAAGEGKSWVLIVACKKELVNRRLGWLKQAGLEAHLIDVDALALANAFRALGGPATEQPRALIDAGAQFTKLVIFRGHAPYLVRDIPWGMDKLLRALGEALGLERDAARAVLTKDASDAARAALSAASEPLVTELQLSFDYFENQFGQPPGAVLVSGGAALVPGFVEALKAHLTQHVDRWAPGAGLSEQFAVAYGLALRAG